MLENIKKATIARYAYVWQLALETKMRVLIYGEYDISHFL